MMVAIGNPVYDLINTPLTRTTERVLSGCSTNACIVCSQLMYDTALVGCVGDDYKKQTEEILMGFGVNPWLYPSRETGGFSLLYDDQGNRELAILGRADPIKDVPQEVLNADVLLFGPILQEIDPSLVVRLSESSPLLFCDPQGFLRGIENDQITHFFPESFKEILPLFDVIKPNELEAYIMTGKNPLEYPEQVMESLYEFGTEICIVTLAGNGSLIYDGSELLKILPYATEARDPTGAGDTYAAGFIVEYMRTRNLYKSGLFASCTASIWVEKIGPYVEITEEKVRKRVEILEQR
ncbi:MAG: ribokinase [Theionarchaea archaeon]|nr:ribokinase [Theionarchaea archaeon]MBU7037727.1 ribokinase [Theionarchaea archaeon]